MTADNVQFLNKLILDRKISEKDVQKVLKRFRDKNITDVQYYLELAFSAGFLRNSAKNTLEQHSHYLHWARIRAISNLLPSADTIIDLGGANGSLYDMGYPHKFKNITIVDLPPDDRNYMYKDIEIKKTKTPNGEISVHFGDMSDLSFLKDDSVDMVWSGESIEHIDIEAGHRTIKEAMRVLKPGGYFCLDTPNRTVTILHTAWRGGDFIHPEHKVEYYPEEIQAMLTEHGFQIKDSWGICEMKKTVEKNDFDYTELIYGKQLVNDPTNSYMQFYICQKPIIDNSPSFTTRLKSKVRRTIRL